MKKAILFIIIFICLSYLFHISAIAQYQQQLVIPMETQIEYIEIEIPKKLETNFLTYIETPTKKSLLVARDVAFNRMESAQNLIQSARECGYNDNHEIIVLAIEDYSIAEELYNIYNNKYENLRWQEKYEEYPIATEIWLFMKDLGYNDYVCAGIMGNMMAETAGSTFNLRPQALSADGGFYGICQWSIGYFPGVTELDLNGQLELLKNTIESQINEAGFAYCDGYGYEEFLELTDERAAARMFAISYERCAEFSYSVREEYATMAYDYFTN